MKPYLLATAATLILSAPAMAGGQGSAAGQPAAGSAQQTYQSGPQQPGMQQGAQRISPDDLSQSEIRQIQQALSDQGFNPGDVDGQWGPQTEQALTEFQTQQNLSRTADLDQETLSALGVQVASMDDASDIDSGTTGSGTTGAGSPDMDESAVDAGPAPAEQPDAIGTQQ